MWQKLRARRWESFDFWGLACAACGSRKGWRVFNGSRRLYSYVAAATCRECGAKYFLKKYRRVGPEKECEALREYRVLQQLESDQSNPPLAPHVYDISPATCAFSMELLTGQTLDAHIKQIPRYQALDDSLRLAASWLRKLHSSPIQCKTGKPYAQLLGQIETSGAPLATRSKVARSGFEWMRQDLAEIEQHPAEQVPLHGDFKASNLIQTNTGVYGIDIGLRFMNAGAMDAAQFMADLLLNRRIKRYGNHDIAHMVEVFMQAYGDNSPESRQRTIWWLLYFLLSWWERALEGWAPALLADRLYSGALAEVIAFREECDGCDKSRAA
jgi:tRNA A-37 threonylcarbamoyl transferase component Bud32